MWIFRLIDGKYEIGYLILGFYFKEVLRVKTYDEVIRVTSCLNGGKPVKMAIPEKI